MKEGGNVLSSEPLLSSQLLTLTISAIKFSGVPVVVPLYIPLSYSIDIPSIEFHKHLKNLSCLMKEEEQN